MIRDLYLVAFFKISLNGKMSIDLDYSQKPIMNEDMEDGMVVVELDNHDKVLGYIVKVDDVDIKGLNVLTKSIMIECYQGMVDNLLSSVKNMMVVGNDGSELGEIYKDIMSGYDKDSQKKLKEKILEFVGSYRISGEYQDEIMKKVRDLL